MKYNTLTLALCIGFLACSKGGDSSAPPTNPPVVVVEPNLAAANAVTVDIDPGPTTIYGVVGTSQKIEVKLVAIPENGVTIDTYLINPIKTDTVFKKESSSKILINPVTVTGLVPLVLYNLRVVVKSQTTPSNFKTIEFKMSAK